MSTDDARRGRCANGCDAPKALGHLICKPCLVDLRNKLWAEGRRLGPVVFDSNKDVQ